MRPVDELEQEALLQVLSRNEHRLLALPGAHYVDVGYKYVNGQPTDQLAIRVHVDAKVPESQLEDAAVAPEEVEGVPVDVLQTNPELQNRDARFDPLRGGVATTNSTSLADWVGTLGTVVFDRLNGAAMALSNHHVYVGTNGRVGDAVAQPSSTAPLDVIGNVTRWNAGLDCAVATLNAARPWSTGIVDYPSGVMVLRHPRIGEAVTKSGRTTGTTFGVIDGVSATDFTVVPDPARPAANDEISMGGDSGSIWLHTDSSDVGVGLHFAGERDPAPSAERAWAKRLVNVRDALNIRFRQLPAAPIARGDTMHPGQLLNADQSLSSLDGRFTLIYQSDGNLVLYRNRDGRALWASGTHGNPAGIAIMQGDGNLVLYDPDMPLWSTGTHQHRGSRLIVQNDGNVVIHQPDGRAVWASNTWVPVGPGAIGDDMNPGEVLDVGASIISVDGRFALTYQTDGNLVLYRSRDGQALWSSGTHGKPAGIAIMQGDGNLVLYAPGGKPLWSTETHQHPGSRLIVQSDGNVVVYRPDGEAVWASNSVQSAQSVLIAEQRQSAEKPPGAASVVPSQDGQPFSPTPRQPMPA